MTKVGVIAAICCIVGAIVSRAHAVTIYAQTGFNDQSGVNADGTVGSPYSIGQTINGISNNEPGWTSAWKTLDGGGDGGSANAVVQGSSPFEGDGALAVTVGSRGSTQFTRDFGTRTDEFVVEQRVNFGSVGEFDGYVMKDNYPFDNNTNGPQWRLIGAIGSRHFEVFNGNSLLGGTWINTGIAQKPGQWQDVAVDVNVVTQQWAFAVDGVAYTGSTLGFIGQPAQLNGLYYFDTAAGSVDSIIVRSTPEPGTSLLVFAAVGALSLARHKRPGRRVTHSAGGMPTDAKPGRVRSTLRTVEIHTANGP